MSAVDDLIGKLVGVVTGRLKAGLSTTSALVQNQAKLVAEETVRLAQLRTTGSLKDDDEGFQDAVDALADVVKNFNLALVNLALIGAQQAYDDVMDVVWGSLDNLVSPLGLQGILKPLMP